MYDPVARLKIHPGSDLLELRWRSWSRIFYVWYDNSTYLEYHTKSQLSHPFTFLLVKLCLYIIVHLIQYKKSHH